MRQDRRDHPETLPHCFRRTRKIDNQRPRTNTANTSRDHRHRRHLERLRPDRLRNSRRLAFDHLPSRLRRIVARPEARSARRDDQVYIVALRELFQRLDQRPEIIRKNSAVDDLSTNPSQQLDQRRARRIFTLTTRTRITNSDDYSLDHRFARTCSFNQQRSRTTSNPASTARCAASRSMTPSCNQTAFAPTAIAWSTAFPASSERRKMSTSSIFSGTANRSGYDVSPNTDVSFGLTGITRYPWRLM